MGWTKGWPRRLFCTLERRQCDNVDMLIGDSEQVRCCTATGSGLPAKINDIKKCPKAAGSVADRRRAINA